MSVRRFVVSVLIAVLAGCTTSPTGRSQLKLFPASDMTRMGLTAYQQIKDKTPVSADRTVNRYVDCVADAITSVVGQPVGGGQWEVTVFKADDTVNAFALPGGKIGVYTGILKVARTPAQLAAVIGHEIGHVEAGHANERVSTEYATQTGLQLVGALAGSSSGTGQQLMSLLGAGAQVGIILPFSRIQESEADKLGLRYMARAGFDPSQAVELWQRMSENGGQQPPELLSTHPSDQRRIHDIRAYLPQVMPLYEAAIASGQRPHCARPTSLQ